MNVLYQGYRFLTKHSERLFLMLLERRLKKGKELSERIREKEGVSKQDRPYGPLIWIHAASIGEAQSALILIDRLIAQTPDINILVTTGTVTSARVMESKLPENAIHQFYPLDHPEWVESFLENWSPDLILWLESELWPNMLHEIKKRQIPAALVNARISPRSLRFWKFARPLAKNILETFSLTLAQTETDALRLKSLGAKNVTVTDNLKYSARPLPFDQDELQILEQALKSQPLWVFASTHKGEEEMAARIHQILKKHIPRLLTLIVPRHPERRDEIRKALNDSGLKMTFRGTRKNLPQPDDDLYIVDTLGELGLFYSLCPVACIGRSFSDDGGGGHNPLEAAQLGCAVLHGPNVQNLQQIYDEMDESGAALRLPHESALTGTLLDLLKNPEQIQSLQEKGRAYCGQKADVIKKVMAELAPLLEKAGIHAEETQVQTSQKRTSG